MVEKSFELGFPSTERQKEPYFYYKGKSVVVIFNPYRGVNEKHTINANINGRKNLRCNFIYKEGVKCNAHCHISSNIIFHIYTKFISNTPERARELNNN